MKKIKLQAGQKVQDVKGNVYKIEEGDQLSMKEGINISNISKTIYNIYETNNPEQASKAITEGIEQGLYQRVEQHKMPYDWMSILLNEIQYNLERLQEKY